MKKEKYIVTLVRPAGVTKEEIKSYILDAVATMKGCYDPEDLITDLNPDTVSVTNFRSRDLTLATKKF